MTISAAINVVSETLQNLNKSNCELVLFKNIRIIYPCEFRNGNYL